MQAEDVADDEETGSDEGLGPTLNENLFPNTWSKIFDPKIMKYWIKM